MRTRMSAGSTGVRGAFAAGRGDIPHTIRICLGTPRDTAILVKGLDILADLLAENNASLSMIV